MGMESVWYCQLGEQVFGPINFAQLQALAQSGQVQPGTLLRQGEGAWIQAGQVPSLFAFAAPAPAVPSGAVPGGAQPQAARPTAAPVARLVAKPAAVAGGGRYYEFGCGSSDLEAMEQASITLK